MSFETGYFSFLDGFVEEKEYSELNGTWYLYWISFKPEKPDDPTWCHGICEFTVSRNIVQGHVKLINHPYGDNHFFQRGEIRGGRLFLFDVCVENKAEFTSIIYPDLSNMNLFVGIWNGFDNLNRPIAGPNVMSRKRLKDNELTEIVPNIQVIVIK